MLPHAPGVQMQAIPEDAVQEDSGDEEDDPDKRISSEWLLYSLVAGCFITDCQIRKDAELIFLTRRCGPVSCALILINRSLDLSVS